MNREEVLDILRTHKPTLAERFGVTDLALFGSFARDEATERSDVDVLVGFEPPPPPITAATLEPNSTWKTCLSGQ